MKYNNIKGYRYRVAEPVDIKLVGIFEPHVEHDWFILDNGCLRIKEGYMWDGTSGPTIQTNGTRLAGLVHDALYQCIREGYLTPEYKDLADQQLRHLIATYRRSKWAGHFLAPWRSFRGWYFYWGVRLFGKSSTKKKSHGEKNKVVFEA